MQNLYIFRDTVSGNSGDVFQSVNDATMRRSCIRSLASVSPEIARDTVVLHIGTIDYDLDNCPIIRPVEPRIALSGSSPDIETCRNELMKEALRFTRESEGESDEE